ncbi:AzlD domain-containing protein [Marinobacterium aestuariivivens]|uniref:AzlD domain-containing protein n=1 Tax=Marinobacterium aestuariivivens TaxID=1698799 RepID=A0ABW2A667_9GAMM
MSELSLWLLFLAVGCVTFALRLSFIQFYGRLRVPSGLQRALHYVPSSVLAALVLPAVIYGGAAAPYSLENPRIWAALVAALVAWKSRNILFTLVAGMGTLWTLQYLA